MTIRRPTRRVLLCATTTGYQVRAFDEAAAALGIELQLATDRCHVLEDPWRDRAIAVRFHDLPGSVEAIVAFADQRPIDGVLAVGDTPAMLAARAAQALNVPWHSPQGADNARHKLHARERLAAAGLPVPEFGRWSASARSHWAARLPVVVKPAALSGSRGVIRADTGEALDAAVARVERLLQDPALRARREPDADTIVIERFIPGTEYAIEGALDRGLFHLFAIFDKPDPLDGPFFEETIYVTPPRTSHEVQRAIVAATADACSALGLWHGPVHAECRVNAAGVFLLEVAARPIGGLCARALRFDGPGGAVASLEALLLSHASGTRLDGWHREQSASGVMMVPIPTAGVLRRVDGVEHAAAVPGIEEVRITAKTDQRLVPLPEGATYLGFIFARAESAEAVDDALRTAHGRLRVRIDRPIPIAAPGPSVG